MVACKIDLLSRDEEMKRMRYRYFDSPVKHKDAIKMAENIGAVTYNETSSATGEGNISDFAEIITKSYTMFRDANYLKPKKKKCTIC